MKGRIEVWKRFGVGWILSAPAMVVVGKWLRDGIVVGTLEGWIRLKGGIMVLDLRFYMGV